MLTTEYSNTAGIRTGETSIILFCAFEQMKIVFLHIEITT